MLQLAATPTENVVAVAIVTLASVIQGAVAISSSRKTRHSVGEQITELRAICIGVDGKNGLRKDITDIKTEVERIRDGNHERNNAVQAVALDVARVKERLDME